ncbi:MAG: Uma2 family endonuclease, partial [Bryobacterales bacterium]|nr:Uma2 family endonuclease [Bryobacterales bacterium]
PPDFVLEVASPSTADTDSRHKAREYSRIGVREYWRIDPQGALMSSPLEGFVLSEGRYSPAERVAGEGERVHLRSEVLGLELRSARQAAATVLVFRDPATGEEFDGALAEAERRRLAAEREKRAAEQRASVAEERARALEERLRTLTAHAPPPEGHP